MYFKDVRDLLFKNCFDSIEWESYLRTTGELYSTKFLKKG